MRRRLVGLALSVGEAAIPVEKEILGAAGLHSVVQAIWRVFGSEQIQLKTSAGQCLYPR